MSCKAVRSLSCCTPFSNANSSVLTLVTTSPSRPTSAIPFQKFNVSSVNRQKFQVSVNSLLTICETSNAVTVSFAFVCSLSNLRSLCVPSFLSTPVTLHSSLPFQPQLRVCPLPLLRHCPKLLNSYRKEIIYSDYRQSQLKQSDDIDISTNTIQMVPF